MTLKVRREHLLLAELDRRVPELGDYLLTQDCPIPGGCSLKRPDILYEFPRFFVQVEVDEGGKEHEDDRDRLEKIRRDIGRTSLGFVLRINPDRMLNKIQHSDYEVKWTASKQFEPKMKTVATFIQEKILGPCGADRMGVPDEMNSENPIYVKKFFF